MKQKTHKKRSPYWKALRHFKASVVPSKKRDLKRTQTKIMLRKNLWDGTDTSSSV